MSQTSTLLLLVLSFETAVSSQAFQGLFHRFHVDKCPPSQFMLSETMFSTVSVCCSACIQATGCSGVCYRKSDKSCRLFLGIDLFVANALMMVDPGFVMWWKDTPAGCKSFGSKAYHNVEVIETRSKSQAECVNLGGTLALPQDQAENAIMASLVTTHQVWLGMTHDENGIFVSVTGTPPSFFSWRGSEPTGTSNENCAEADDRGGWNDLPCESYTRGTICSFDLKAVSCQSAEPHYWCFCPK